MDRRWGLPAIAGLVVGGLTVAPTLQVTSATGGVEAVAPAASTNRVSVSSTGEQGNFGSYAPQVSADCASVAFASYATNFAPQQRRKWPDVFVRDRQAHTTVLASRARRDELANGDSRPNAISANGRVVAYDSTASNLVKGDTNDQRDVFVRDVRKRLSELVSVPSGGGKADSYSQLPDISRTGRYVVFTSYATNLVADDTNGGLDVFLRDRLLGTTERVSLGTTSVQPTGGESSGGSVSDNGRYVVFESAATNLTPEDDNGTTDVFRYDRELDETVLVSAAPDGHVGNDISTNAHLSGDGRYVSFASRADDLVGGDNDAVVDIFVRDLVSGVTTRVSLPTNGAEPNDGSFWSSISDNGNVVVFDSQASNMVPRDTNLLVDSFVHYRDSGVTRRIDVNELGRQSRGGSISSSVSANGRCGVFSSGARLVKDDTNHQTDVYLRQFGPPPPAT